MPTIRVINSSSTIFDGSIIFDDPVWQSTPTTPMTSALDYNTALAKLAKRRKLQMATVSFRPNSTEYSYLIPKSVKLKAGDFALVDTSRGLTKVTVTAVHPVSKYNLLDAPWQWRFLICRAEFDAYDAERAYLDHELLAESLRRAKALERKANSRR